MGTYLTNLSYNKVSWVTYTHHSVQRKIRRTDGIRRPLQNWICYVWTCKLLQNVTECHVHPTASLQNWPGLHTNTQHCLWRTYRLYYRTWRLFTLLEKLFIGPTVKTSHFYIVTSRAEQIFVLHTLIWTYLSMAPGRCNPKKKKCNLAF